MRELTGLAAVILVGLAGTGCTVGPPAPGAGTVQVSVPAASATPSAAASESVRPSASSSVTATATASPAALKVTSVLNFRDLAGTGLSVEEGAMNTGAVYRSGKLATLSKADRTRLAKAGITDIIDLRTTAVAKASPDPTIKGANYHLVNVFAVDRRPVPAFRTVAAAKAFMRKTYTDFVTVPAQRKALGQALELIAAADGPVIVHCTEGKDRTGWVAALLQFTSGADENTVLAEYLKSNDYRASLINRSYRETLKKRGATAAKIQRAQLRVQESYLQAGREQIERSYGSVHKYLRDGLGVSQEAIDALQKRFLD